ncbi:PAS domain S-box protein [Miltoncostaea marina]|uniref:PAS domain S-box protein n=1 Tax=Miltoncostaea marina TaxID=2843215 RepID=UPI001C3C8660|nr:PAS domain S-box protein [Miltoncostaea marina]
MARRALPHLIAALVAAIAVAGAVVAWNHEQDRAREERGARAQTTAAALRFHLATVFVSLEGLRGLVEGSDRIDPERFEAFATVSLAARGGLLAGWVPRVTAARRDDFGRPILERQAWDERPRPAGDRAVLFPVALLAPASVADALLGIDIGYDPQVRPAIVAARDTGRARMTPPVSVPALGGTVIIAVRAAYGRLPSHPPTPAGRRAAFSGVVASVHRLDQLGDAVLADLPEDTVLEIRDGGGVILPARGDLDGASTERLDVAGREWEVRVAGGHAASILLPAVVLAGGLVLAALLWLLMRFSARREAEARRAADELARAAERHRAVVDTAADGIITIDERGVIETVNTAAERLFGYTKEELAGRNVSALMPDPDSAAHDGYLERYLRTGEARIIGIGRDVTGLRRDGSAFPMHLSVAEMRLGDERRFTGIVRDISARVAAEERVRALNDELEERVRERTRELEVANRELEAFSYSVSHDLRAPLRSVNGLSAMLVEDHADGLPADARDLLERIRAAGGRMGELIDDLLQLSRISRTEMRREEVDLGAIAHQVADGLREHDPGRRVEFRVADGLRASGDPRLLRVVLDNLLGNAWKFTRDVPDAVVEFGACADDGTTRFYVRDNGAGFDMAYADKLFGPFQRLHHQDEFEGTGIGLATVHRIVRRHGGEVRAEGRVGRGATMWFTIPPAAEERR